MLRYLTHKLKTQSLNEAESYTPKNGDDHDSGTESDDEGADAEELQKYLEESGGGSSGVCSARTSCTLGGGSPVTPTGGAEHHSSEEELAVINCCKRKWSQARLSLDSAGSDEEVRDLMCASCPVEFRCSPPAHASRPARSLSPPPKLFHASAVLPPHELLVPPHRPPHRAPHRTRPHLDFEKMQQNRRKRSAHFKSFILCESV